MTLYPLKGGKVIDILYEAAKKLNLDLHKPPSGATAAHSPTGMIICYHLFKTLKFKDVKINDQYEIHSLIAAYIWYR